MQTASKRPMDSPRNVHFDSRILEHPSSAQVPTRENIRSSDWLSFDMVATLMAGHDVDRIGVGFLNLPPVPLIVKRARGPWKRHGTGPFRGHERLLGREARRRQGISRFSNVFKEVFIDHNDLFRPVFWPGRRCFSWSFGGCLSAAGIRCGDEFM